MADEDDLEPGSDEVGAIDDDALDEMEGGALQTVEEASLEEEEPALVSEKRAIFAVPVEVVVSVGRARPLIGEMMSLRRDSVLPLDSRIDDPVEVYVGERLVARGELQELDDENGQLGVRLTEVVGFSAH